MDRTPEDDLVHDILADPLHHHKDTGISADWVCPQCGAQITVDEVLLGSGTVSHAVWCRVCGHKLDRDGPVRLKPIEDIAQQYYGDDEPT